MRKYRCFLLMVCLFGALSHCHADGAEENPMRYRMDYAKKSFLRTDGSTLHFVNIDLEWPSWVNGERRPMLMNHISSKLFGFEGLTLDECLQRYLDGLGKPLFSVPDGDEKTPRVYHTMEMRLVDYSKTRYISFRIITAKRKSDSAGVESTDHHIFTYDIVNDKLLGPKDLLKKACFPGYVSYDAFMDLLIMHTPSEYLMTDDYLYSEFPIEMCLMNDGLLCDFGFFEYGSLSHVLSFIPYNKVVGFYRKELKKLLNEPVKETPVPPIKSSIESKKSPVDTLAIYDMVDEHPVFQGGDDEMIQFMLKNLQFPPLEKSFEAKGRVVTQFVIERDGTVSLPTVVQSASPGFDREAIRVVNMMPKWSPGKVDGVPVRTRVTLPLTWRSQ